MNGHLPVTSGPAGWQPEGSHLRSDSSSGVNASNAASSSSTSIGGPLANLPVAGAARPQGPVRPADYIPLVGRGAGWPLGPSPSSLGRLAAGLPVQPSLLARPAHLSNTPWGTGVLLNLNAFTELSRDDRQVTTAAAHTLRQRLHKLGLEVVTRNSGGAAGNLC